MDNVLQTYMRTGRPSSPTKLSMSLQAIDTHAHVFLTSRPMAPGRRYTPGYDAPLARYLEILDQFGMSGGVLVQPSFYGTDNSYMLECLAAAPLRLRGIAVLDPHIADEDLQALDRSGVVGVRFNLIGAGPDVLDDPAQRHLLRRIQALGWQVEVQSEGAHWLRILKSLDAYDGPIVIDHFGRPAPAKGVACEGFQAILRHAGDARLYVKMSAAYRCGGVDVGLYAEALLQAFGPARLLWGSDWPWTQFEAGRSYDKLATAGIPGLPPLMQLLAPTAVRLFRFAETA